MIKANVREHEKSTMDKYGRVFNSNIYYEVDMYPYSSIMEFLHNAIKIERKFPRLASQQGNTSSMNVVSL